MSPNPLPSSVNQRSDHLVYVPRPDGLVVRLPEAFLVGVVREDIIVHQDIFNQHGQLLVEEVLTM